MRCIQYPYLRIDGRPVVVDVRTEAESQRVAGRILSLIVRAYSHEYEGPDRPIADGTFAKKYNNDAARQKWHDVVVPGVYRQGGEYYTVNDPQDPAKLAAVLKVLPGGAAEPRFTGQAGIAEVVVDPMWQRQGLGAAVIATYLGGPGVDPNARIMSDVIDGGPMASWLSRRGFREEADSGAFVLDPQNALPTHYYVSEQDITVASLAQELQRQRGGLLQGAVSLA